MSARARVALVGGGFLLVTLGAFGAVIYQQISRPPALIVQKQAPAVAVGAAGGSTGQTGGQRPATGASSRTGNISRQEAARALEWLARNSLREDRLMGPPADNAHYYFSRLLELDASNKAAKKGFSEIAERFVILAEQEFSQRNYDKAQAYITLGLQVDPGNDGLATLQSMIETRERTFFETVMGYFKAG